MKKILNIYSLVPVVWFVAIMTLVAFHYQPHGFTLKIFTGILAFYCYYGIGFIIWLVLLINLKIKGVLSTTEALIHFHLVLLVVLLVHSEAKTVGDFILADTNIFQNTDFSGLPANLFGEPVH